MPDPTPRMHPAIYQPFVWPEGNTTQLSPRNNTLNINLVELMEQRQSRRDFNNPIDDTQLGDFLWLACRNRSSRPSPFGPDQESRVYPSAGAMHPVHILIARDIGPWKHYDPVAHTLVDLPKSDDSASAVRRVANDLIDVGHGVLLGLVAEPGKTASKYESHETLVWRDAGVVLGYMSVVAEALGLAFCPLGITGQPYLSDCISPRITFQEVGIAVVGAA